MLDPQVAGSPVTPETAIEMNVIFGPFVLDRSERVLMHREREVALPERSLRLLEILVRSAGRTVSKHQLIDEAWQGAFVSDTSLTEAMSRLRVALGDEAREPRFIRTVHGRGYRFIALVGEAAPGAVRRRRSWRPWIPVSLAASIALVGVLALGSIVGEAVRAASGWPGDRSAEWMSFVLDPLRAFAVELRGDGARKPGAARPHYRLAEVSTDGTRLSRFSFPALPLNGFSVDQAGQRVAFSIADGDQSDAWVLDPRRGRLRRVATGGYFSDPVWTYDGRSIAVAHSRNGTFDLVLKTVDDDEPPQLLHESPVDKFPESWSRDGRSLVYSERHPETGYDLWVLRQGSDDAWVPTPLLRSPGDEAFGAMSPDGRYLSFTSHAGESPEIFIADLETDRAAVRVSTDGGAYPFWSGTGDRLHYVQGDALWSVDTREVNGGGVGEARISTELAGLYLGGSVAETDRVVVALLE